MPSDWGTLSRQVFQMSLNVLVVDDSAVMRSMVIRTLKLSGVPLGEIHQAGNGKEGLLALRQSWVDLLLVDLNMPVMSGEEMIARIRQDEKDAELPILVISTEGSQTRIEAIRGQGAEFVHKPFTPEELGSKIRQLTGVTDVQSMECDSEAGFGLDF